MNDERQIVFKSNKRYTNSLLNLRSPSNSTKVFAINPNIHCDPIENNAEGLRREIIKLRDLFPNLQYLLSIEFSTEIEPQVFSDSQRLIFDILLGMFNYEKINCLVLDISVEDKSIYASMNHDKIGINQNDFDLMKSSRCTQSIIQSIERQCKILNLSINFEIGSTVLNSVPNWE